MFPLTTEREWLYGHTAGVVEMKSIWKSKTWWVNALTLTVSVATVVAGSDIVAAYPRAVAVIGSVVAAANMALRLITKVPVEF